MKKRRFIILIKLFLDNFKVYIKFNRFVGFRNVYSKRKTKYPKNFYNANLLRKEKKIKIGYFFKWDRFKLLYLKISSMGTYYYWFTRIEKIKYYIDFNKFFFNTIYNSLYYKYIIPIYIFIFYSLLKILNIKIFNNIKNKNINILMILNINKILKK